MNTSDLERALRAHADLAGPPPADLLPRIHGLRRARRRRRTAVLTTAAAAALIAVAVPTTVALTADADRGSTAVPADVQIYGLQTRGSLADDTALVAAVADLSWPAAAPDGSDGVTVDPIPGSGHVEFLGDVEGTRYALVTGAVADGRYAAWFTAPVGADAAQFVLVGQPEYIAGQDPLAFADTTVDSPVVIVVAAPGDTVGFSDRAVLTSRGTITRNYTGGQQLDDGVAAQPTTAGGLGGMSVRVERDDITAYRSAPDIDGSSRTDDVVDVAAQVADPRGTAGAVTPQQLAMTFTDITAALQLPLDQLQPTVLWAGTIPGPDDRTSTALVVGITAPSGGSIAYGMTFVDDPTGGYSFTIAGWETYDSTQPLTDRAQLLRTTTGDGTATGQPVTSVVLLEPLSSSSTLDTRLSSDDGDVTSSTTVEGATTELSGGVVLVPGDTTTTTAVVLDASTGQTVTEAELMRSDYFDRYDYGSGPA